jgi:anthranilate synthase component 2
VYRNDEFNIDEIAEFDKILLSPGPGVPEEAGLLKDIIRKYGAKSILGVCLGQQAIGEVYGGTLSNLKKYTTVLLQW